MIENSAAVVNCFGASTGTTSVALGYAAALRELGFKVNWYQCAGGDRQTFPVAGSVQIEGLSSGVRGFDFPVNVSYFFPRRLGKLKEKVVVLSDQVLSTVAERNPKSVVVCHDLREFSWATKTNFGSPFLLGYLLTKLSKAAVVFADTKETVRQLQSGFRGIDRVDAVHPCATLGPWLAADGHSLSPRGRSRSAQRAIYVAVDRPYKHVRFLIDLAKHIELHHPEWGFQLTIVSRLRPSTRRYLSRVAPASVSVVSGAEDIGKLYDRSDLLLFPSEYEGFGMPLAEALAMGVPVVASPSPSVCEVVAGAAILQSGYALEDWVKTLEQLQDPGVYSTWQRRAQDRGRHFSPIEFRARLADALNQWGIA